MSIPSSQEYTIPVNVGVFVGFTRYPDLKLNREDTLETLTKKVAEATKALGHNLTIWLRGSHAEKSLSFCYTISCKEGKAKEQPIEGIAKIFGKVNGESDEDISKTKLADLFNLSGVTVFVR
jgi:hypothetical protein